MKKRFDLQDHEQLSDLLIEHQESFKKIHSKICEAYPKQHKLVRRAHKYFEELGKFKSYADDTYAEDCPEDYEACLYYRNNLRGQQLLKERKKGE